MGDDVFDSHQIKAITSAPKIRNPTTIGAEVQPRPAPFDNVRRNTNRVEEDKPAPSQS